MVSLGAMRNALGVTQDELGQRVSRLGYSRPLSRSEISKYESGERKPRPVVQVLIAAALGLDADAIQWPSSAADEDDESSPAVA
jgi:transcriptional regulator with XRE-family HTH domain